MPRPGDPTTTAALPKPLPEHLFANGDEFWQYVTFVYRTETQWWERWTEHRDYDEAVKAAQRQRRDGHSVVILRRIVRCDKFSEVPDAV